METIVDPKKLFLNAVLQGSDPSSWYELEAYERAVLRLGNVPKRVFENLKESIGSVEDAEIAFDAVASAKGELSSELSSEEMEIGKILMGFW
ncbi:MAG: hypothetical protein WC863_00080 [Patescibacteria group bacterium]